MRASRGVNHRDAVLFQLGHGDLDTSVDFFPRVGRFLDVSWVVVPNFIVMGEALNGRGVVALGAGVMRSLPAGNSF